MHDYWLSLIPDYITDDLSETERQTLEAHLKTCSECCQVLAEWRTIAIVAQSKTEARNRPLPPLRDRLVDTNHSKSQQTKKVTVEEEIDMTTLRLPQQKLHYLPWTAVAVLLLTFFFSILLLGSLDLQPVPLPQGQGLGDIPEDPIELFQLYLDEVWNKQNMDAIPLLLSENHVHHDASMSESRLLFGIETTDNYITSDTMVGHEAFAEYVAFEQDVLPDVTFTAEGLVANGDTISGRVKMTYEAFEATVPVSAIVVDGKLAEIWFDVGTMTEAYNLDLYSRYHQMISSHEELTASDFDPFFSDPFKWYWPLGQYLTDVTLQGVADSINNHDDGRDCKDKQGEDVITAHGNLFMVHEIETCLFDEPFTWGYTAQPINQRINVETTSVYRIQDGKIVEMWAYHDDPRWWSVTGLLLIGTPNTDSFQQTVDIFNANKPENRTLLIAERYVDEIWNAEELDAAVIDELYAPRLQFSHNNEVTERIDRDVLVGLHSAIRQAFPDGQIHARDILVDGNNIAIQFNWTGTHTAAFEYQDIMLPPSNDQVSVNGVIVLGVLAGQDIIRETWYADFPFLDELEQITEG